jgi:hypothetical protein
VELDQELRPALERAVKILEEESLPCVFLRGGEIVQRGAGTGVAPLIAALEEDSEIIRGTVLVDRIIGKAAAMLAVLGGVSGVYGMTMSAAARDYLAQREIPASCGTLTERIINRAGTGLCPMEQAVLELEDPASALPTLKATLARLRAGGPGGAPGTR